MKIKAIILSLLMIFGLVAVGGVRAEEVVEEMGEVEVSEVVEVPDPESSFFGLQVAWMNIKDNVEIWLARTDEKKTELEVLAAEKEAVLLEKIADVVETNPDLADRLELQLDNLGDRYGKRLERIDERMGNFGGRSEGMEQRMLEWQEEVQNRRQMLEAKKNQIQERMEDMGEGDQLMIQDQLQDGSGDGQQVGPGDGSGTGSQMQGGSVNLQGSVQKVGKGR